MDVLPRMRRRNGDQLEGLSSGINGFYKLIAKHVWTSNVGHLLQQGVIATGSDESNGTRNFAAFGSKPNRHNP